MELYEASQVSSLSYQKETLVKDGASNPCPFPLDRADLQQSRAAAEFSRSVYLTDGYKKDETEQEWYYKVRSPPSFRERDSVNSPFLPRARLTLFSRRRSQSFCYKAFHYSSHKEKSASSPSFPIVGPRPDPLEPLPHSQLSATRTRPRSSTVASVAP